jgi:DNA-binding transcriptional LysR family regulator
MDRLDAMATLVAAVDGGSLSAASRALGMPLATVSRKVADLEAHLRTQLVVRTSRRLGLTEAGRAYVAASRRILDEIDEAERAASGEYRVPRGHLTITAPVMFGRLHVEPVVLDFLRAYPDVTVRLVLADYVVNLVEDRIDAAIRIGELPDSSMVAARLGAVGWWPAPAQHTWSSAARRKRRRRWAATPASCSRGCIPTICGALGAAGRASRCRSAAISR